MRRRDGYYRPVTYSVVGTAQRGSPTLILSDDPSAYGVAVSQSWAALRLSVPDVGDLGSVSVAVAGTGDTEQEAILDAVVGLGDGLEALRGLVGRLVARGISADTILTALMDEFIGPPHNTGEAQADV